MSLLINLTALCLVAIIQCSVVKTKSTRNFNGKEDERNLQDVIVFEDEMENVKLKFKPRVSEENSDVSLDNRFGVGAFGKCRAGMTRRGPICVYL